MFFLRRIYVVFFAFFPSYQYAMKEKIDEDNIDNNKENDKQNNEQNNEVKDGNSLEYVENEQSKFISIFRGKRNTLNKEIEIEKTNINNQKNKLEQKLKNLENEKDNLNTQKYEENYKKVEKYVYEIDAQVIKKCDEIDKEINKGIKSNEYKQNLYTLGVTTEQKFVEPLKKKLREHADTLLRPRVMCDDDSFSVHFNQFKEEINNRINREHELPSFGEIYKEVFKRTQLMNDFKKSEERRPRLYKFFRNALYRQAYLLFYNTARVISNVKIEYDIWRSDTGKHIWGVNSSANVYYKYRSAWNYRVFKFNLFYIEFSFGLFHLLLKPLKRIAKIGSVLSYGGGDYFKKIGLDASEIPFWDMINISLVQISVGPVKINGPRFSLFDPIFFVMTLCYVAYFGFGSHFNVNYNGYGVLNVLTQYRTPLKKKKYWNKDHQKEWEEYWDYLEEEYPRVRKIKIILEKIGLLAPGSNNTFINKFRLYCKNNILFNIIELWKFPYNKGFHIIDIVFYTFVGILKSAPEIFKEISSGGLKLRKTIHEKKIIETHYLEDRWGYDPSYKDAFSFRGRCDLFFLSIALLVYSMIDSISIDLRWIIENESVRKYCVKLKREVCRFFKK